MLHEAAEPYVKSNLIHDVKTDTYHRELERYDYNNILCSESLFFYDSQAVVSLLNFLMKEDNQDLRLLAALKGIDMLLDDFGMSLKDKQILLNGLQLGFKEEFKTTHREAKKYFSTYYRKKRSVIEILLRSLSNESVPVSEIFAQRSKNWKAAISQIISHSRNATSTVKLDNLLASYIHMFVNRIFQTRQRMYELVIYDLLYQYYTSLLARERK